MNKLTFLAIILLVLTPIERAFSESSSLKVLWSNDIPDGRNPAEGLVLQDISQGSNGAVVGLARKGTSRLVIQPNESGLGKITNIDMSAEVLRVVQGEGGDMWMVGLTDRRMTVPGWTMSSAFLGRLDPQGKVIAEYSFPSRRFRLIEGLALLDSGKLVVTGRDGKNWLASISDQGEILWQQWLGVGKHSDVLAVGNRIVMVTFDSTIEGGKQNYKEDVVLWNIDLNGYVLGRQIIRASMNTHLGVNYGRLSLEKSKDSLFVLSSWHDFIKPKPLEVTKLSLSGTILWSKELSHSISSQGKLRWATCNQGQTVLDNGDLLVACAIENQIFISRIDARSGDSIVSSMPLPVCHEGRPAVLFPIQRPNGAIWVFGSRPISNVAKSCTWLGELSLGPSKDGLK
jgi:hypothetical protein